MHHYNAKSHTTSIIREFLEKGKLEVLVHPAYNTNFPSCDFWVFGVLKRELHNKYFESGNQLVTAINCFFEDLSPEEFLKMMIAKWKKRMLACIANDNGYFEKDIVDRNRTFF